MSAVTTPSSSANPGSITRKITLIYGSGRGFSGQRFASEMLVEGLCQRGWQVRVIHTPVLDRVAEASNGPGLGEKLILGLHLLAAWLKGLRLGLGLGMLHVNLGLTRFALIRDGFPLLVRSLLNYHRKTQAIIWLQGNVFMAWDYSSFEAHLLRHMVRSARYIAVLGPNQKKRLIELGIAAQKVVQMDNTCLIAPITEQKCIAKQTVSAAQPLKILYLSSLIETKGYPEFVEAISQLATRANFPIEATLCGKITVMDLDSRFPTHKAARKWLEAQISQINQSSQVRLRWIDGAEGEIKESLFREAHIFILPSRYKVEAQPIAMLEALASGCIVITTQVGEIPSTVNQQTAILLDEASPQTIAKAIIILQSRPDERQRLALNGLQLFNERFAYEKHLNRWEQLLNK